MSHLDGCKSPSLRLPRWNRVWRALSLHICLWTLCSVLRLHAEDLGTPYPSVVNVEVPNPPLGIVTVNAELIDLLSRQCSVFVEVALDGSPAFRVAATTGSLIGLPSSPGGEPFSFQWNSERDLGFHAGRAVLKLSVNVTDPGTPGADITSATPVALTVPHGANRRSRLATLDTYMVYYGAVNESTDLTPFLAHQLVILHPTQSRQTISREVVQRIQQGFDPLDPQDDVLVLGYVSIGEDTRMNGLSPEQFASDPRFRGDGNGPRVDPRGPGAGGTSLDGIDPLGVPTPGGTGYASYYLDDNSVYLHGQGDGVPDRNAAFGGCFVNAGDPAWFEAVNAFSLDSDDRTAGLRELLTLTYGRCLGADGVFMDTFDTAAPNAWTNTNTSVLSKFEWTAPGFRNFTARLRNTHPDRLILQNRGLFFFDPQYPQYRYTTAGLLDLVLFESFRPNSDPVQNIDAFEAAENRYVTSPRLMAEANRPAGFRVLSLGYAGGAGVPLSTLNGTGTEGLDSLLEDIRVTQDLNGFRHYITNAGITFVNTFVRTHSHFGNDSSPPQWSSTYNTNRSTVWGPPTVRVGIQQALPADNESGAVLVRWDVALDLYRVGYRLYYAPQPLDFAADPTLRTAQSVDLLPLARTPDSYWLGVGPDVYPYEAVVRGLTSGTRYHLCVRAYDHAPGGSNEERNTVVLEVIVP